MDNLLKKAADLYHLSIKRTERGGGADSAPHPTPDDCEGQKYPMTNRVRPAQMVIIFGRYHFTDQDLWPLGGEKLLWSGRGNNLKTSLLSPLDKRSLVMASFSNFIFRQEKRILISTIDLGHVIKVTASSNTLFCHVVSMVSISTS